MSNLAGLKKQAIHYSQSLGLDSITFKTRDECEEDGEDFRPLDPAAIVATYAQLTELAASIDEEADIPVRPASVLIREDGAEVWIPLDHLTADTIDSALVAVATEVAGLSREANEAGAHFAALLRLRAELTGRSSTAEEAR